MKETQWKTPLNLQFFAEEGNETQGEDVAGMATADAPVEEKPAAAPDLNALLAGDKGLQSQFDRLVGKALATAHTRWEKEKSMTAEQLAELKAQEKSRELAGREQALLRRELRAEALGILGDKGIPAELVDCVSLEDEAAMKGSVAKAEQAFRAALDKALREKLAGAAPKGNGNPTAEYMAQFRAAAGVRAKL